MKLAEELGRSRDEVTSHQKVEWLERFLIYGESAVRALSADAWVTLHCMFVLERLVVLRTF